MGAVDADPVVKKGLEIFSLMDAEPPQVFNRQFWIGKIMAAAMDRPEFRLALFRFIDVLPSLTTTPQIIQHIKEYFLSGDLKLPGFAKRLLAGVTFGPTADITAALIKRNIIRFSKNFIVGDNPGEAIESLRQLWQDGKTFSVDLLGEVAVCEAEADHYQELYLRMVDTLAPELAAWPARLQGGERVSPQLSLSVKISSLYSRIGPLNHDDSVEQVKNRLRPIFRKVKQVGGQVFVDMEMFSLKDLTLDIFTSLLEEPEFREWDCAGIALQAYLRTAEQDLSRLLQWARQRNRRIHIRLVKGAYWEYERALALQHNWPLPVFAVKSHTDACFERCVEMAMAGHANITLAVASHNVRSVAAALLAAERLGVPRERFEFQALHGMAEPIKQALMAMGYTVRIYAPLGELLPGMAYLVRRLLENTSNVGFLRQAFAGKVDYPVLLAKPEACPAEAAECSRPAALQPFLNEPPLDFALAANRAAVATAIRQARERMGQDFPVIIGGTEHRTQDRLVSLNPAQPAEVVCTTSALSPDMAVAAVAAARSAQPAWGMRSAAERAACLFAAAQIARRRRLELAAWEILEVGKNWAEADADVCEAIDYLEYYGREMIRLGTPVKLGNIPGEDNCYFYQPRGCCLVAAPWNFPLAISMGMAAAALVTGNAVLYKPSSQSLMMGWQVYDILHRAGIPDGVINFLPGRGSVVGDCLVEQPHTDMIIFTGSLEVGLGIVEKAGKTWPGQRGPKKAVIETGGKNAIIVDADADFDQAVPGVIQSAFGFQGQKCSACSRVIVLAAVYDRFLARLAEAVNSIAIGSPEDPKHFMGPVVDAAAQARIFRYIEAGKREGKILAQLPAPTTGYYVPPTVFVDLPPDSKLVQEEIFGPVLAVLPATDLEQAIALANASPYALTGGLFSRSPANIEKVRREFSTGNLYINRSITGALVGRQPFGGFKMSGVGSKAGGPDYLQQFMEPRVVTENTMRRGFTREDVW